MRASPIEIENGASGCELRVGRAITLRASRPFGTDEVVACGFPGTELDDELVVDNDPLAWELSGNCAFASQFDYSS